MIRTLSLILALCCLSGVAVFAADVDCDSIYCYSAEEFSPEGQLEGICVTGLPAPETGTVMLGQRVIRPGDILTADQLDQMTFAPLRTESDVKATVTYLPIYADRVEDDATMTLSIRGKKDHAPVAEDLALETYKNLPNKGSLKVHDPEGQPMTYSVVRQPRRGQVTVENDGSFTYTPKKNKVGVDSFTYTAVDPAGNVSREATVTVQILKPTDSAQYTDTAGQACRFAAEWMRNTGLFVGEKMGEQLCFQPEKTVTRGEFLAMLTELLDISAEDAAMNAVPADTPNWLRPYLAAAIRSGMTADLPTTDTGSFEADRPITGAEAAVMLQNVLALTVSQQVLEDAQAAAAESKTEVPAWASVPLTAMAESGITLVADDTMTRGQVAQLLYQVKSLADTAPGMQVIRMQK
jgi:hypothetical protein